MDLNVYLLESAVRATTPPGETAVNARCRIEAITAMLRAYDSAGPLEAMMACQCIMMQFLFNAAMRDASNLHLEPAALARARAEANSASRTLHQWISKFEKERKRNEIRATEAAKAPAVQSSAKPPQQASPEPSVQTTAPAAAEPPAALPVPTGQTPPASGGLDPSRSAAERIRSAASVPATSGPLTPPAVARPSEPKVLAAA